MSTNYYAPRFDVRVSGLTLSADISSQVTSVTYDSSIDTAEMFRSSAIRTISSPIHRYLVRARPSRSTWATATTCSR